MECSMYMLWLATPFHRAKHPVKVHVWAGIRIKGATAICVFEGTMDVDHYIQTLRQPGFVLWSLPFLPGTKPPVHSSWMELSSFHITSSKPLTALSLYFNAQLNLLSFLLSLLASQTPGNKSCPERSTHGNFYSTILLSWNVCHVLWAAGEAVSL